MLLQPTSGQRSTRCSRSMGAAPPSSSAVGRPAIFYEFVKLCSVKSKTVVDSSYIGVFQGTIGGSGQSGRSMCEGFSLPPLDLSLPFPYLFTVFALPVLGPSLSPAFCTVFSQRLRESLHALPFGLRSQPLGQRRGSRQKRGRTQHAVESTQSNRHSLQLQ